MDPLEEVERQFKSTEKGVFGIHTSNLLYKGRIVGFVCSIGGLMTTEVRIVGCVRSIGGLTTALEFRSN